MNSQLVVFANVARDTSVADLTNVSNASDLNRIERLVSIHY